MINEILTAAAVPFQEARFPDPPDIFVVYFDATTAEDGEDHGPALSITHEGAIELYAPTTTAGSPARSRILAQLNARGLRYTTQGWYWLSDIRRYQEIIEFTYIVKT